MRTIAFLTLSLACIASNVCATWDGLWPCTWQADNNKYDFSSLSQPSGHLASTYGHGVHVSDTNYTYQFSFCSTLSKSDVPPMCDNTTNGDAYNTAPAAAYQYDFAASFAASMCHRIGGLTESDRSISYIDSNDPIQGIQITFAGGDEGSHTCKDKQRQFTVKLPCGEHSDAPFYVEEGHADGKANCEYTLNYGPSPAGCPVSCGISDGKICGGREKGFCAMDSDANEPRCFCNQAHSGYACESAKAESLESGSSCDGTCVALIFVFLFLLAGFAGVSVVLWRVRKLEKVDQNFRQLQDDFDIDDAGPVDVRDSLN